MLTPRTLDELVGPADWLTFYKLNHRSGEAPRLRYVPVPGSEHAGHAARLAEVLSHRVGTDVAVIAVDHLESERSGKLFCCVRESRP